MSIKVVKRDGREVDYDIRKIKSAIHKAIVATKGVSLKSSKDAMDNTIKSVDNDVKNHGDSISVEEIQDIVETNLMKSGLHSVAKQYILYRAKRSDTREMSSSIMQKMKELTFVDAKDADLKRENANIDGNTAMGTMLRYGSEVSKEFVDRFMLDEDIAEAHKCGDIHIHDKDFYPLTMTCCQIDIGKLLKGGFSTGHGVLREPNGIGSYAALTAIAIQADQNDMHGGQAVPAIDYGLATGVAKTFAKEFVKFTRIRIELLEKQGYELGEEVEDLLYSIKKTLMDYVKREGRIMNSAGMHIARVALWDAFGKDVGSEIFEFAIRYATEETDKATYQAMEGLIHNLNTMNSRAGAQVPFSSISYGTDTSIEGRLVIRNILLATDAGLGDGETPIFPVQIFKVKEGINYNADDPNYDLYKLSMKVSAKRLFPNYDFLDAPFNLQYYKEGHPETEVAYMGCRTRVMGNVYDKKKQITFGRGNLSFTSINLPRIALKSKGDIEKFYKLLDKELEIVHRQLLNRFAIQCKKKVKNFPFLMGQGVWIDSDKLGPEDTVEDVIKHGSLTIGFIGLAETLVALTGKHHGESEESQKLGLEIIGYMRKYCDKLSKKEKLNYAVIATPAEGLSGRFVKLDRKMFGKIKGVTDREYYTNSFHIPVYFKISAFDKIRLEAPYHELTNGGHITYVEMDGNPLQNLTAFEDIIRTMKECGIGYGAINHPVDRDCICGYSGVIKDICPHCGRKITEDDDNVEHIRRITGYLVGNVKRFNDAKRAEERDRVKHI